MTATAHGQSETQDRVSAQEWLLTGVTAPLTAAQVIERFRPLFESLRAGVLEREQHHIMPVEEIARLKRAGLGALRLPVEDGGAGVSLETLFEVIAVLAAHDSHIAHALRGHFGFLEIKLAGPDTAERRAWIERTAAGQIVGNATSEQTGTSLTDISTTVTERDGRWYLSGRKFYSTGTLFSEWTYLAAARGRQRVTFAVPTDAPGVSVVDDWDGFGQGLTASGTTVFDEVEVDPATIRAYEEAPPSHIQSFYQLYLLAVLAGIGRSAVDDAVAFVGPRTRTYVNANASVPADDPQVLAVVGRASADAFTARALVLAAARELDAAVASNVPGTGMDAEALGRAEVAVYQAQLQVIERVLAAATDIFEVGGASACTVPRGFDRHWRNARVIANHNPAVYKARQLGEYEVKGLSPFEQWKAYHSVGRAEH